MTEIDIESIRQFYHCLNHSKYGVTELAIIAPTGEKGIIATGFFNDEKVFVKACQVYNGRYNIYAGRNPRPKWLSKVCENYLDVRFKQRAKDNEIEHITAISLDIDPIRPKGTSSTEQQHQTAIDFAVELQKDLGGCVDDSGNGAYLWFQFVTPIWLDAENRDLIKQKCQQWQKLIVEKYQPEKYGLKIDGCYDFSRLKKVIGTLSVKGDIHRLSKFIIRAPPSNKIRDAIIDLPINRNPIACIPPNNLNSIAQSSLFPPKFTKLLQTDHVIRQLWNTPDFDNDTSKHDWELACACFEAGIIEPSDLAAILIHNPYGKFRRDRRYDYVQLTVNKLLQGAKLNPFSKAPTILP